jgi:hypothetical protein
LRSIKYLARTLAPHARVGKVLKFFGDLPVGRVATGANIAAELGEDANWLYKQLDGWHDIGWLEREPTDFGTYGYRATPRLPPVDYLEEPTETTLWATALSAAITLDRMGRRP